MAFDEGLAERLRDLFREYKTVTEKKMFGGLAFMLDGRMFVGILGDRLMARIGPDGLLRLCASRTSVKWTSPASP